MKRLFYEFDEFRVDTERRLLLRNEEAISLTPKVFDTLLVLVENRGEVVSKDRLMQELWSDSFVEEANIAQNIAVLRRALGEKAKENRFIVTIPGRGYQFVADVRIAPSKVLEELPEPRRAETTLEPAVHHTAVTTVSHSGRYALASQPLNEKVVRFPELVATNNAASSEKVSPEVASEPSGRRKLLLALASIAVVLLGGLAVYRFAFSKPTKPSDGVTSLAVLPLKPIDKANRNDLYEVGIADSLIQRISRIKGFVVRPLTTVRKYDDIAPDPLAVGKEQQVDYVLMSNYQLSDGKIRVTCDLFNVRTGEIQQTYRSEKDAKNLFAMEDAIANEVGTNLQTQFAAVSTDPAIGRGTTSEEAYRDYLQATYLLEKENLADQKRAMELLDEAVKIDPNYARAWAAYARAHCSYAHFGGNSPDAEFAIAEPYLERAFSLDNDIAEAYAVKGIIESDYHWNFAEGEKDFLRAIEIAPNSDNFHRWYANRLASYGRSDEAVAQMKIAVDLNPSNIFHQLFYGRALYAARRYDDSIKQLQQVAEMDSAKPGVYSTLWRSFHMKGDYAQAYASFMTFQRLINQKDEVLKNYENLYAKSGWQGVLHGYLENTKAANANGSAAYFVATLSAMAGERDQAFQYLDQAVQIRSLGIASLKGDPELDSIRDDPRFEDLLARTGMAGKS